MKWKTIPLALVLCAILVAGSFQVLQTGPDKTPTASLVRHAAVVDAETVAVQKAAIIAAAGRNAVAYISAARGELKGDNPAGAKRFMNQASGILSQIRNGLREDGDDRRPEGRLRVPLWAQVNLPDEQAVPGLQQSRLEKTRRYAVLGKHGKVVADLAKMEVNAVYSYIDMPLDAMLARLKGARKAMQKGDEVEALRLLDAATDVLISETIEIGTGDQGQAGAPGDA